VLVGPIKQPKQMIQNVKHAIKLAKGQTCRPCIHVSRPFMTKKSAQNIALVLDTSHTRRRDEAFQKISITIT